MPRHGVDNRHSLYNLFWQMLQFDGYDPEDCREIAEKAIGDAAVRKGWIQHMDGTWHRLSYEARRSLKATA